MLYLISIDTEYFKGVRYIFFYIALLKEWKIDRKNRRKKYIVTDTKLDTACP